MNSFHNGMGNGFDGGFGGGGGSGPFNGNGAFGNNYHQQQQPNNLYGVRRFHNNAEAHDYVNTILNNGGGFVGTIAGGVSLRPVQGCNGHPMFNPMSNSMSNPMFDEDPIPPRRGPTHQHNHNHHRQQFSMCQSVSTIGVHPLNSRLEQRPTPSSTLVVFAEVTSRNGYPPAVGQPLEPGHRGCGGSPMDLSSSQSSEISSCSTDVICNCCECRCRCRNYCSEHARMNCSVHKLGSSSQSFNSDDSGWDDDSRASTRSDGSLRSLTPGF